MDCNGQVKRTISNCLATLVDTGRKQQREEIIEEVEQLVWHLYDSLKTSPYPIYIFYS